LSSDGYIRRCWKSCVMEESRSRMRKLLADRKSQQKAPVCGTTNTVYKGRLVDKVCLGATRTEALRVFHMLPFHLGMKSSTRQPIRRCWVLAPFPPRHTCSAPARLVFREPTLRVLRAEMIETFRSLGQLDQLAEVGFPAGDWLLAHVSPVPVSSRLAGGREIVWPSRGCDWSPGRPGKSLDPCRMSAVPP